MTLAEQYLQENPGALDEIVLDHIAAKRRADAAKVKEPTDFNVQNNPNLRAFKPYPRMLYNWAAQVYQRVETRPDHEMLLASGWKEEPWPTENGAAPAPAAAADSGDSNARLDTLEGKMFTIEQMMAEILERLPKPKKGEAAKV